MRKHYLYFFTRSIRYFLPSILLSFKLQASTMIRYCPYSLFAALTSLLLLVACKEPEPITFEHVYDVLAGKWKNNENDIILNFKNANSVIWSSGERTDSLSYLLQDYKQEYPRTRFHLFIMLSCGDYACASHLHIKQINAKQLHLSEWCEGSVCEPVIVFDRMN